MAADDPSDVAGSGRLKRNSAFAVAPRIATIAVAVGLSPYIVAEVGLAAFGFWSIVQAIVAYAQVADGGIPMVATRHIAQANERGDLHREREVLSLTVVVMAALVAVLVSLGAIALAAFPDSWAGGLPDGWRMAALLGVAAFALSTFGRALGSVAYGHHRWEVEAVVATSVQVVMAAATVAALELGVGVPGLGVGVLAGALVGIVGYAYAVHRLIGLRLRGARPSWRLWREFRRQGINLQVVAFVAATNAQSDRLLLIPFAPLSWIGAYSLGARVAVSLRAFPVAALGPLIAHVSAVDAGAGRDAVRETYVRAVGLVAKLGTSTLLIAYGAMFPAVLAWLGNEYEISAAAASLLGLGYAVNLLTGPGTATAVACGKAELDRDYNLIGLGLNLALSVLLGFVVGPWGVVLATTLGLTLSSMWLLRSVDTWLPAAGARAALRGEGGRAVVVGAVIAAGIVALAVSMAPAGRITNLVLAIVCGAAGTLIVARSEVIALIRSRSFFADRLA